MINNTAPTISLTANPSNGTAPATIILNATATDTDGSVAKVELFNGASLLTTLTTAPYNYLWENVPAGTYTLSAKATDNLGVVTSSSDVAVSVTAHVAKLYDIHADHLGTPRMVTDSAGNSVWEWIGTPFGESLPNQNPGNTGAQNDFVMNLRFPGQVFDQETGLHYNYFRDYDPATGRYVESDPIGLDGGINTFGYVGGEPTLGIDPLGLEIKVWGDKRAYQSAYDYITQDPSMRAIFDRLSKSKTVYHISVGDHPLDMYVYGRRTIYWNPNVALCVVDKNGKPTGKSQSPGLALGHEAGHADNSHGDGGFYPGFGQYDNANEKMVIDEIETPTAKFLKEGVRKNHRGKPVRVSSPTARPTNCECQK